MRVSINQSRFQKQYLNTILYTTPYLAFLLSNTYPHMTYIFAFFNLESGLKVERKFEIMVKFANKLLNKGSFNKHHEFKGNQFVSKKGKKRKTQLEYNEIVTKRLTKVDFNRITTSTAGHGVPFRFTTEVNPDVNVRLLRPANTSSADLSDQYLEGNDEDNEMRLLNKGQVTSMWNTCIGEHNITHCKNVWLVVKDEQKVGICWKQRLACRNCNYQSKIFKLYQEAVRHTRLVTD